MTDRLTLEREAEVRQRLEMLREPGKRIGFAFDYHEDVPLLLSEIDRLRSVLQRIADRWKDCQRMEKHGYGDPFSGYDMCLEARKALGLTETPTDG